MSTKATSFELFRYQLLPINRFLQGDLLTGVGTIEELLIRKNEFFSDAISGIQDFSDSRHDTITKKLYSDENFFLLRIALNKSIHRETKDFRDEVIDNWPSILVAVWNDPKVQMIAIQKRTTVFRTSEIPVKMILNAISTQLRKHHLLIKHDPLFEERQFWEILNQHKGRIKSVEFEMITPNMANISSSLAEDLKSFAKITNSTSNKLKIESDSAAPLHLEENNKILQGLVSYSSEGGGNISLKIEGLKKKYKTSKAVKEIQVNDIYLQGTSNEVVEIFKELLK